MLNVDFSFGIAQAKDSNRGKRRKREKRRTTSGKGSGDSETREMREQANQMKPFIKCKTFLGATSVTKGRQYSRPQPKQKKKGI